MPSPFPGMNPYLERSGVWPMFHTQLVSKIQVFLSAQVRPRYFVRLESRIYIHEPESIRRQTYKEADLGVTVASPIPMTDSSSATATIAPPMYGTLPAWYEIEKSRFIEIRDQRNHEVVTVIELLNPSNKYAGSDREQYLSKRREIVRSQAHFVELDLLRGGPRMPSGNIPACDYCAVVSRVEDRPRIGVWPWGLREAMPEIPIPLRSSDSDARLDLKAVLDLVYDEGGYVDDIYSGLPEPRLSSEDAAWAAQFKPSTSE